MSTRTALHQRKCPWERRRRTHEARRVGRLDQCAPLADRNRRRFCILVETSQYSHPFHRPGQGLAFPVALRSYPCKREEEAGEGGRTAGHTRDREDLTLLSEQKKDG